MNRRHAIASLAAGASALAVGSTQAVTSPELPPGGPQLPALHAPAVTIAGAPFVLIGAAYINVADIAAIAPGQSSLSPSVTITLRGGGSVQAGVSVTQALAAIAAQLAP